jgi:hypothetical protein
VKIRSVLDLLDRVVPDRLGRVARDLLDGAGRLGRVVLDLLDGGGRVGRVVLDRSAVLDGSALSVA